MNASIPDRPVGGPGSAELLQRWQEKGSTDDLDQLLRIEVRVLRERILHRYGNLMRPSAGATDLAQEAVLRWLKASGNARFPTPAALRSYLLQAAWRLLVRRMHCPGRSILVMSLDSKVAFRRDQETGTALRQAEAEERSSALDLALNLLHPADQEILDLYYFQGLGQSPLAERLGVEEASVRKRLQRARHALADKLRRWEQLIA